MKGVDYEYEKGQYVVVNTDELGKLRTSEADKVRCGQKHFETLGVPFSVVVSAKEV